MGEEKLLTVRDVSLILGISEKEVIDLAESGAIPAYKVGGVYLRFKKEQINEFRKSARFSPSEARGPAQRYGFKDRVSDFFYFNDFYIAAALVIILLLFIILRGS